MRKIVMSGLVAAAALLGCAVPAMAGTGTGNRRDGYRDRRRQVRRDRTSSRRSRPGTRPTARPAASPPLLERLSAARPQASGSTSDVTVGIAISCASPTACLSVGVHEVENGNSGSITPFAARLHAGTWKAVAVKVPKGASSRLLTGVSCKAATYCLVVGEALTNSAPGIVPFALTWNGTTLTPIAAPPMPAHTLGAGHLRVLRGGQQLRRHRQREQRDRQRSQPRSSGPGTAPSGRGPRCPTRTPTRDRSTPACTASRSPPAWSSATRRTSRAAAAPTRRWPRPGTATRSPTCRRRCPPGSATRCSTACPASRRAAAPWSAAGTPDSTGTDSLAFAEVWNGKTWTVTKWGGPKGDTVAELIGVSCTSAVRCIAVGAHGTAKAGAPAALAWTGSKWTVLKVAGPGAGKAAVFEGVSCPVNGKCVATGRTGKADGSTATPIAGYWNGSTWKYGPMLPPLPLERWLTRSYIQNGCVVPAIREATHPFCVLGAA